jgi:exoribonuclease R
MYSPPTSIITESYVRSAKTITGILLLENNRTYGKVSHKNQAINPIKKSRLFYKCIPDCLRLPAFIVPYEIAVGFSKKFVNKYVTIRFKEWTSEQQHPVGTLVETIGDVTHLPAFCEYRLCARNLRHSMATFTKHVKSQIEEKCAHIENIIQDPKYNIQHCKDRSIAIDPEGSRDFDDALSANEIEQGYTVSIHIANVFAWFDSLNLWDQMTDACASIYLPDKRRHMLPPILSNDLCILNSYEDVRLAFTAILSLDDKANIVGIEFKNTAVKIAKNYVYETAECLADPTYRLLYKLAKMQNPYVNDTHDTVAHWMIKMNEICGQKLADHGTGIFRKAEVKAEVNLDEKCKDSVSKIPINLTQNTRQMLQSWLTHSAAEYVAFDKENPVAKHALMQTQNYAHITSPIRRLVDLLNQTMLISELGLVTDLKENSRKFMEKHLQNLSQINRNMRAIKKTQQECETLYKITQNPDIQDQTHRGFIIDVSRDNLVTAYIEDLNQIITVSTETQIIRYSYHDFRVFVFEDEYKIKQKLKWTIV